MGEEGQGHAAVALGPEIRERSGNGPEDALYLRLTLKEMISGPTFSLSNIHTRAYMHAPPPTHTLPFLLQADLRLNILLFYLSGSPFLPLQCNRDKVHII